MGQPDAALGAIERALTIYRCLAQPDSAEHEHNLATTLNTHATIIYQVGRREEAITDLEESVEKYRLLASANPAVYEDQHSAVLTNLGSMLADIGRVTEALANTAQAVEIERRLAKANPIAHERHLADQLDVYALVRRKLGKELAEADHASRESAEIRWRRMRHWLDSTIDQTLARPRRLRNKNKALKRR